MLGHSPHSWFPIIAIAAGRLKKSWRRNLAHPERFVGDLGEQARDGRFPIVVFNATAAENGKRMAIANVALPEPTDRLCQGRKRSKPSSSSTVAKASIFRLRRRPVCRRHSPMSARSAGPSSTGQRAFHLADGGYVDNEGAVSALQWLRHLVDSAACRQARRSNACCSCASFRSRHSPRRIRFPDWVGCK